MEKKKKLPKKGENPFAKHEKHLMEKPKALKLPKKDCKY